MALRNKISVVIPTYNSMLLLQRTLESFREQTLSRDSFEIVVVDDGSRDGSKYLVDEYRNTFDISYYYLEDLGYRLAAARNIGIHFAKYPTTLIFDCGMLASGNLLMSHVEAHQKYKNAVVIGLSYGVEEFSMGGEEYKELEKVLNQNNVENSFRYLADSNRWRDCRYSTISELNFDLSRNLAPWVICWGGHVSIETRTLREINGFDENFISWGGEDVELAIRLHEKGCSFQILKSIEAIHIPHHRPEEKNKMSSRENIKYIINKHVSEKVKLLERFGWREILHMSHIGEIVDSISKL